MTVSILPCCAGAPAPVVDCVVEEGVLEVEEVVEGAGLVALAYDGLVCCAGAAGREDAFPDALTGDGVLIGFWAGEIALVMGTISRRCAIVMLGVCWLGIVSRRCDTALRRRMSNLRQFR